MNAIGILEQQQANEVLRLEIAYSNLYKVYMLGDRNKMISHYIATGYIGIPNFTESVQSACSAANKSTLAYLPVLGAGEAILMGVDFPMPVMLKVDLPQTEPNSHTPQFKRL